MSSHPRDVQNGHRDRTQPRWLDQSLAIGLGARRSLGSVCGYRPECGCPVRRPRARPGRPCLAGPARSPTRNSGFRHRRLRRGLAPGQAPDAHRGAATGRAPGTVGDPGRPATDHPIRRARLTCEARPRLLGSRQLSDLRHDVRSVVTHPPTALVLARLRREQVIIVRAARRPVPATAA